MGLWEIAILAALGIIIFIFIRRLPQTREGAVVTTASNISHFSQRKAPKAKTALNIMLKIKNRFNGGFNFTSFFEKFLKRFSRKAEKKEELVKAELKSKLKKKEDREFWIDEEEKVKSDVIAKTYFDEAEAAFKKQDYRRAETLYLEAARENPKNVKIFNRLGAIYLEQREFNDAIEAFKTAVKYDDKVCSRYYNLALAYIGQKNYKEAVRALKKAIELSPENKKYQQVLEQIEKK